MPQKPAALMLAAEPPYPLHGGGALRTASLLHYLARDYTVDLIVFQHSAYPAADLPPGLVRQVHAIRLPHHSRRMAARVARNSVRWVRRIPPLVDRFGGFEKQVAAAVRGRSYEVAIVEHFWCAPYLEQLSHHASRLGLDLHNIESILHERSISGVRRLKSFGHARFQTASRELERAWLPRYSFVLVASEEDRARVSEISPESRVLLYPNSIPYRDVPQRPERHVIAFSGNLEYHPNEAAVAFFADSIWPRLKERWPDLIWRLIGKNPHAVKRYTEPDARTEVTGVVDDAVEELAAAEVVVVPLLAGSGTRFKIIEAWAAARPVVSTRIGAEGLPVRDGTNILLADGAREFGDAVSRLLADASLRVRLGRNGRSEYERQFTWNAAWACLDSQRGQAPDF